jgi:hypothetical protein
MIGVSDLFLCRTQYQLINPPTALAIVNDGVLYIPTATAIPPGIQSAIALLRSDDPELFSQMRTAVVMAKSTAAPAAHAGTLGGRPWPVTRRAVYTQTYAVGTLIQGQYLLL